MTGGPTTPTIPEFSIGETGGVLPDPHALRISAAAMGRIAHIDCFTMHPPRSMSPAQEYMRPTSLRSPSRPSRVRIFGFFSLAFRVDVITIDQTVCGEEHCARQASPAGGCAPQTSPARAFSLWSVPISGEAWLECACHIQRAVNRQVMVVEVE